MAFIKHPNDVYIIGEIGQNHNGDINIAKKLIDQLVVFPYDEITGNRLNNVNGIKLCKRDLSEELSNEQMNRLYETKHSFGKTYGEHRKFLELSYQQHCELSKYIKNKGVEFVDTLCSVKTTRLIEEANIDKVKIASRDITNIPLLKEIAKYKRDVIVSTGLADKKRLDAALNIFADGKTKQVVILHCLSQYPAHFENINLKTIEWLIDNYGDYYKIGYSDHSLGTHIATSAVAMGATYIEKHVTLDKNMKGTDHAGSAEPEEFKKLVHDIRTLESSIGKKIIEKHKSTIKASEKLERSLAYQQSLIKGTVMKKEYLHMISPGTGLKWEDLNNIVGKKLKHDVLENELVEYDHLCGHR